MPRISVAPGQTIVSTWGNTVFDQSVIVFNTPADRDAQWPTPLDGSVCYTNTDAAMWLRRGGVWKGLPLGYIAAVVGPATAVACGQTLTTILTLTVSALRVGRRYRVTAQVFGQQNATASAVTYVTIADTSGNLPAGYRLMTVNALPGSAFASGGFVWDFVATAITDTFTLAGISTTTGVFTVTANFSQIAIEDIGT